jgi:hypothetical protein
MDSPSGALHHQWSLPSDRLPARLLDRRHPLRSIVQPLDEEIGCITKASRSALTREPR